MSNAKRLIQRVLEGEAPDFVVKHPGLHKAMSVVPDTAITCPQCGFEIPTYPGAYPKCCPQCGYEFSKETEAYDATTPIADPIQ